MTQGPQMRTDPSARLRRAVGLLTAACLVSLGAVACSPSAPDSASAVITADGVSVTLADVTVSAGAGVAPVGAELRLEREDRALDDLGSAATALDGGLSVTLTDDDTPLQPAVPLTIEFAVDDVPDDAEAVLALVSQTESGEWIDSTPATWQSDTETLSAQVSHLSWFAPVKFDLGAVWRSVRDATLQGLGLETARPDCVDRPLETDTATISVVSTWNAWLCVERAGDSTLVDITANSGIPFVVTTAPATSVETSTPLSATGVLSQAIFDALFSDRGALLAPGGSIRMDFGSGEPQAIHMEQYPAMLILSILLKVLEVAIPSDVASALLLDRLEAAGCAADIVAAATTGSFSVESVGRLVQAVFSCAGVVLSDGTPVARIVLAIVSAAPAFFAGSVTGLINEVTNQGSVDVAVSVVRKNTRWVVDARGVGPLAIGSASEDVSGTVGEAHSLCASSSGSTWQIGAIGDMSVTGIIVLGEPSRDAPATRSGVTLGSAASELTALNASSREWQFSPDYAVYTWQENGQILSAWVDHTGIVIGLGVGTDLYYPDYC